MNSLFFKTLTVVIVVFLSIQSMDAVPADPFPIKYTQPDGTEITLQLKGDERVHWAETTDGYTLLGNGKNGWEYAIPDKTGDLKASGVLGRDLNKRTAKEITLLRGVTKRIRFSPTQVNLLKSAWEAKNGSELLVGTSDFLKPNAVKSTTSDGRQKVFSPNGTKKLLMILIQYPDLPFTFTKDDFYALMNTQNYNLNNAKGSVKDYFREQSYWALDNSKGFDITTDVVGIYTAKNNMAYYGADGTDGTHDLNSNELMLEAVTAADADVDYSQYDNDGDGSVDGVYIIYAGYGQASSAIANTIWPHAGGITGKTFDGKTVSKYSCSNELTYNSNLSIKNITTIGVICHEFGHVCGAPDYYDTDYASSGGNFPGTGNWDVMCYGVYDGVPSGSQPAHMNPFEKIRNGWVTPTLLTSAASLTIPDITTNPVIYKYNTSTPNEYYLLENRQQTGFNTGCPGHGLIIYHTDGNYIAAHQSSNNINVGPHQGFYMVCANSSININSSTTLVSDYGTVNSTGCPFPGTSAKTQFSDTSVPYAKSWAGLNTFKPVTGIYENTSAKTVGFTFMGGNSCTPPTSQASNLTFSNIQDNQLTVNWTRGNGDRVIVLARKNSVVSTTPLNGTAFNANNAYQLGDLIDQDTYVIYDGTGTYVTFTDLLKMSTYYFAVFEYNAADHCYSTSALTGSATTTGCSACVPTATTKGSIGITNVSFNTINNTSAYSLAAYTNYAETMTNVTPGKTYTLSVTTYSYTNTVYTKAWIDWNNDCTFQSSEEYDLGSSTNNAILTRQIQVPVNAYAGTVTLRVRTRFGSAPTACDNNNYSEAEDYTLKVTNITWDGSAWNPVTPTTTDDVVMNGNYNDAGFACHNLTVNAGKQITIVSGTLAVGGNLTLKSNSDGTATLIDNGTVTVTGTTNVEQYLSAARNWYVSTPVTGGTATAGNTYYKYIEAGNNGSTWTPVSAGTTLTTLTGYIVQPATPKTVVFTGTLNTGAQTIANLTSTATAKAGFNLVGNPYPSYVNWMMATKTNLSTTLWYRTQNTATTPAYVFDTYNQTANTGTNNNGSGAVTGIIPPMQAFWVKVNAGKTGSLAFDNTMRSHQELTTNKFRAPADNNSQQLLRLQVSNGTNSDEAIVLFNTNATDGYDDFDSPKMSNGNVNIPEIYTLAGTEKLVINGLNTMTANQSLLLGFTSGATNTFSIQATEVSNFSADTRIILKDNTLNVEHDLTDGSPYTFTSDVTSTDNRFSVVFRSTAILAGFDILPNNKFITVINNADNQLVVVRNGDAQPATVTVCTAIGQKLFSTSISGNTAAIHKSFDKGVYLVTVNESGSIITKKVIIN